MNITVQSAQLPTAYVDARSALAKCEKVDECQGWADRAAALASYAKQAKDDTMLDMARKIQLRAIERGSEVLAQIKPEKGGRPAKTSTDADTSLGRLAAGKAAGLSRRQTITMLNVGAVPKAERDALIESANPPTVTQLAERGIQKREKPKPEPHREEWADWIFAVKHLREIPACGLAVLAARNGGLSVERLLSDAVAASGNLDHWINSLNGEREKADASTSHIAE